MFSDKGKTYQDMVKLQIIPFWEKQLLQISVQIAYLKILLMHLSTKVVGK